MPPEPLTIAQALAHARALGLERLDAQMLLLHVLARAPHDRAWLLAHDADLLDAADAARLEALVQRRLAGEPVAYLTGFKAFYGLNLAIDARVLDPRPDTETLVDWALELLDESWELDGRALGGGAFCSVSSARVAGSSFTCAERPTAQRPAAQPPSPVRLIDLGTGSGAIALALKHSRPAWQISAVDLHPEALAVARANAQRLELEVQFNQSTWLAGVQGTFHAIVSNPPYICAHDPHLAALSHEPLSALASGPDGLDDIRSILTQAPAHLEPGGWLLLEHGYDQASAVRALLTAAGFAQVQSRCDLAGIERCSGGCMQAR